MPALPSEIFVTKETLRILKPLAKLVGIELVASELPNIRTCKKCYTLIRHFKCKESKSNRTLFILVYNKCINMEYIILIR